MSIRAMTLVWEFSRFKGTRLLLMMAIADHANDDLIAWPSRDWLARKCRMSVRYTINLIDELLAAKPAELELLSAGGGRGHSPRYRIAIQAHERGLRGAGDVEIHKGGGIPHPLSKIKGEARLRERVRPASTKNAKGEARLRERVRRASPEPSSTPTKPITTTATATHAAAAAAHGEWWSLEVLSAASKLPGKRRAEILAANPSPGAFVSKYLYALSQPGINRPPLWVASQVIDNPGQWEGDPFETLAGLGPAGLAHVLTWIRDDAQSPLEVNGAGGAALAFRGELQERHHKQPARLYASVAAAIADLGLGAIALPAPEPADLTEREPAPESAPLDAWQEVLAQLRGHMAGPAYDRLMRCQLVSASGGRLVLAVPTKPEFDWLSNRMGRTLAERFSATLTLREE